MSRRVFWTAMAAVFLAGGFVDVPDSSGFWGGGPGHHRGITPINWRVAGTVVAVQLAIPTQTGPVLQPALLIQAVLKGSPGNAQFIVVGIPSGSPGVLAQCGGGFGQTFSPNDMVITFADQSMLFAQLGEDGGWICFQEDGTLAAVANMEVIGGTGRFEDAGGSFTGRFLGQPVGASGALSAETGTIEGWIDR